MIRFLKKERVVLIGLFLIGIFSRLLFLEKMQSHWDGPDYTQALLRYSFVEQTPSPPGYPLYIGIGKLFFLFVHDPHLAILLVSVLFAGIGAVVFCLVGKIIFNSRAGIIAAFLFLSAPTIYYFGITANPYGILPTTSAILAVVVFLIVFKKKNYGFLLGIVFSFAMGIRPQDAMFLFPLFLFGFFSLIKREKYKAILIFVISFLLWFVPTAAAVGGVVEYGKYIEKFAKHDSFPDFSIDRILNIWLVLVKGLYLTLGISSIFLLFYLKRLWEYFKMPRSLLKNKTYLKILFFLLWISPSLFFNIFVRSDHAAHQMTFLSAFIFLTSYAIAKFTRKNIFILYTILLLIVSYNLYTFFRDRDIQNIKPYSSQSYHYSEIVKNNIRLEAINSFIKKTYDPQSTLIIVDPEIFRPVSYYLKNYHVNAYSSLDLNEPLRADLNHEEYQWHYNAVRNKHHVLTVPKGIKTIICIPNNKEYTVQADHVQQIKLAKNAFIYVFNTDQGNTYNLSVHTITKSKK